ncbi:hypothetical protein J4H92_09845 [Leucobacter weissii]|uniref:Uncharacterized protein n=1 Tax=Leucobacter weissii TaxID=1983706 RepID=A0A939SAS0_9MICO|nr:hypothetical protein [Leucobacter weissii]MBO1902247.1 hypothetical protein [Leucobacter weissii]
MAANTSTETPAAKAESFDRKDLTRTFARLKHEVGGLVDDANRLRPFYARSKEEAIAKRDAALKVLSELADRIDALKKQD